jgi:hypothetical protein
MVEPKSDEVTGGWELAKLAHWVPSFGFLTKYYWGDHIQENEMSQVCGRDEEEMHTGF